MTIKLSTVVRNAKANSIESTIGTSAVLKLRTGSPPASISDTDSGTEVVVMNLPSDWLSAASGGVVSKSGTWQGTASASGVLGHFRIYASDGSTQHIQGTVTIPDGGGDMIVDNTNVMPGQKVTVNTFLLTDGN